MTTSRALLAAGGAIAVAASLVSGGSQADPQPSRSLPIAGIGSPASTVVVDSFGNVTDRRRAGPAVRAELRRVGRARPLAAEAPRWARRMYRRSLLVLSAMTEKGGAVIAGAREGWAYAWPRDAAAVSLAYDAAGYRREAQRVARFLLGLDLGAAARFNRDGTPVPGRDAQGDARGWVEAVRASRPRSPSSRLFALFANKRELGAGEYARPVGSWRDRPDYQEKSAGDYLGNAVASGAPGEEIAERFRGRGGVLAREAGETESGVDSATAWAVRPFPRPALFPAVRRSLRRLVDERGGRFGIVPSEDWTEDDPWTAPTAWTAWSFAALARVEVDADPAARRLAREDRRDALRLMGDLRRAATPQGLLPERVDAETGEPRSTTPLAWSHAFAILALRELWP